MTATLGMARSKAATSKRRQPRTPLSNSIPDPEVVEPVEQPALPADAAVRRRQLLGILTDLRLTERKWQIIGPGGHALPERQKLMDAAPNTLEFFAPVVQECFDAFDAFATLPKLNRLAPTKYTGPEGFKNIEQRNKTCDAYKAAEDRLFNAEVAFFECSPSVEVAHELQQQLAIPGPRTPKPIYTPPPPPPETIRKPKPANARIRGPMDLECKQFWESSCVATARIMGLGGNVVSFVAWLHMRTQELEDRVGDLEKELAKKRGSDNGT